MARTRVIPRDCIIAWVQLEPDGAEISYRCAGDYGRGEYPLTRGQKGFTNYPKKWLRGVRSVRVGDDAEFSGQGRVDFVLSPRSAVCWRDRSDLFCKVK